MSNLVTIEPSALTVHENQVITTSRDVAKIFGKKHQHVLRDIRNLACPDEFTESNFGRSEYKDGSGKTNTEYQLTKDGFMLLVMGYNGEEALRIKKAYINAFNVMVAKLSAPRQAPVDPVETLEAGKIFKSNLSIAKLIYAAKNQALLSANRVTKEATDFDVLEVFGATHLISESKEALVTASDIGVQMGLSAQKVNLLLIEKGLMESVRGSNNKLIYSISEKGIKFGEALDTAKKHSDGTPIKQIKWYLSAIDQLLS